jgi:hypothetical protein
MRGHRRRPHPKDKFTPEEDNCLCRLIELHGTSDWTFIALQIPNRNRRQCRERWENYLSPSVKNAPWTADEEMMLAAMFDEEGPCWRRIAACFNGRTDINVKNHWRLMHRRTRRGWKGNPRRKSDREQPDEHCLVFEDDPPRLDANEWGWDFDV